MDIDGALSEPGGIRYFGNIQVFDIAKEEDGSLFLGQASRRFPDRANLIIHNSSLFRRKTAVWPFPHFVARDKPGFFPELKPSPADMISYQVYRDP